MGISWILMAEQVLYVLIIAALEVNLRVKDHNHTSLVCKLTVLVSVIMHRHWKQGQEVHALRTEGLHKTMKIAKCSTFMGYSFKTTTDMLNCLLDIIQITVFNKQRELNNVVFKQVIQEKNMNWVLHLASSIGTVIGHSITMLLRQHYYTVHEISLLGVPDHNYLPAPMWWMLIQYLL